MKSGVGKAVLFHSRTRMNQLNCTAFSKIKKKNKKKGAEKIVGNENGKFFRFSTSLTPLYLSRPASSHHPALVSFALVLPPPSPDSSSSSPPLGEKSIPREILKHFPFPHPPVFISFHCHIFPRLNQCFISKVQNESCCRLFDGARLCVCVCVCAWEDGKEKKEKKDGGGRKSCYTCQYPLAVFLVIKKKKRRGNGVKYGRRSRLDDVTEKEGKTGNVLNGVDMQSEKRHDSRINLKKNFD